MGEALFLPNGNMKIPVADEDNQGNVIIGYEEVEPGSDLFLRWEPYALGPRFD